jgi:2-polyprenyl-3-methyl-5-hydroxy-6-metoxy-1,4-benzoquinol methylase
MSAPQLASMDQQSPDQIRSRPCPNCYLCGERGELLYEDLSDRLFGAPGGWNFRRCRDLACGLLWLDPMPAEEDIGKAYAKYYTHINVPEHDGRLMWILRLVHDLLLSATLISGERKRLAFMYLDGMSPGRVLDVGCGDGSRLARLRSLGWDVRGQEMDPEAASRASQSYGVQVHLGPLDEAGFDEGEFDAVAMNHVIEHVHDPVRLLAGCARLLRKGGTLIAVTPNAESCGHKRFGSAWRGLEPPRHIHLFSQRGLRQLAGRAGFGHLDTWTTPAHAEMVANGTLDVRAGCKEPVDLGRKLMRRLLCLQYQLRWQLAHMKDRNSGEECVLRAVN